MLAQWCSAWIFLLSSFFYLSPLSTLNPKLSTLIISFIMILLEYLFHGACPPRAFSTLRWGGVGEGAYDSFNITHYCGDSAENVRANRQILCAELGITDDCLVLPRQTHSDNIAIVTLDTPSAALEGVDAVITNVEGLCIGVSTADCIPLLYFDAQHRVIAAVHAGWRGTVSDIACKTLRKMQETFHTRPEYLQVVVGPGISARAFEVGEEVVEVFRASGFDMERIHHVNPQTHKSHLDLWEANVGLLVKEGVCRENVHVSGICTFTSHEDYFSARRLGIHSGRIFTGIMLPLSTKFNF